ncbi:NAD(P)/FAD-dependent oxidoreductase [Lapidilactobacillus bayanensis]|uniref:NAD(P)/FAD-dependent oxidoreductase n=1 Tax=Lapidilactobacillus bayanensis TaxID=2485998 RepID=UPI00384D1B3A
MNHKYDLLIIGGGPVGLFAAHFAGMRNADVAIVESLPQLGGQVAALFPEKNIYDLGGIPSIKAKDLIQQQLVQLNAFAPKVFLNTSVTDIASDDNHDFVVTTTNEEIHAKAIIIAVGNGAFAPRKLAFDYDQQLERNGMINYFITELDQYRDKNIAIAGGGDSAIDCALALESIAKSVTIIHRRDQFRALESSVAKMNASTIRVKTPYLLNDLHEKGQQLQIDLKKVKTTGIETMMVDKLIVNYGFTADSRILRKWDLELNGVKVKVNTRMETSRPKVYAIGDAADYPGKMNLIATGYGEAPIAVTTALETIYPEKVQPLHSTSLFN